MIMLKPIKGSSGGSFVWRSSPTTRPGGAGLAGFTLTHNQGRYPNAVRVFAKRQSITEFVPQPDFQASGPNGWFVPNLTTGNNELQVYTYRIDDGFNETTDVFFELVFDGKSVN